MKAIFKSIIDLFVKIFSNFLKPNIMQDNSVSITRNHHKHYEQARTAEEVVAEVKESMKDSFSRKNAILNARPEKMGFEEYKEHLQAQKKWIKNRLNGFLVYKAIELYTTTIRGIEVTTDRTFPPFVGDTHKLKIR